MSKISKRAVLTSLVAAAGVGGIAVAGIASATAPAGPTVDNASARFVAPSDETEGAFTFATDVTDDSGIKNLKVLAWPDDTGLKPKAKEMEHVDDATCKRVDDEKSTCTYTLRVTEQEAAGIERGVWTVSVLLTTGDGEKKFVPEAATVTLDF